jgi:hypothetical protein
MTCFLLRSLQQSYTHDLAFYRTLTEQERETWVDDRYNYLRYKSSPSLWERALPCSSDATHDLRSFYTFYVAACTRQEIRNSGYHEDSPEFQRLITQLASSAFVADLISAASPLYDITRTFLFRRHLQIATEKPINWERVTHEMQTPHLDYLMALDKDQVIYNVLADDNPETEQALQLIEDFTPPLEATTCAQIFKEEYTKLWQPQA